mmetsp:Transcript_903/g.974  ORF Transcript_903/g.974 Transcript_903/m.974 type:complete len:288 (-) Transcript_903:135-998(-)
MMKIFKRKIKSGYCNISEPISDLDPARISAIKARHVQKTKNGKSNANNITMITDSITLTTAPSAESKRMQQELNSPTLTSASTPTSSSSNEQQLRVNSLERSKSEVKDEKDISKGKLSPASTIDIYKSTEEPAERNFDPKTPDTFFEGKNRKRISLQTSASLAPTEHPIALIGKDERDKEADKKIELPVRTRIETEGTHYDHGSTTSDLDKTFAPQIVSVNSDITEPSYGGPSSRRKKRSSWKDYRKLRRCFHETFHVSKHDENKGPLSVLDMIVDAICTHPDAKSR